MIKVNFDSVEKEYDSNKLLTFVEYLEYEEDAKNKLHVRECLNKSQLLLIYVCYLLDMLFPKGNLEDVDDLCPTDVAIVNGIFIKIASIDPTYTDRTKWLTDVIKLIYETYKQFLQEEDFETLFSQTFSLMDNLLYDMITKEIDMKKQAWEYLHEYDKRMVTVCFIRYLNVYLDTIDWVYDDKKMEDIDIYDMADINGLM